MIYFQSVSINLAMAHTGKNGEEWMTKNRTSQEQKKVFR